jgi:hypothetical protein
MMNEYFSSKIPHHLSQSEFLNAYSSDRTNNACPTCPRIFALVLAWGSDPWTKKDCKNKCSRMR